MTVSLVDAFAGAFGARTPEQLVEEARWRDGRGDNLRAGGPLPGAPGAQP